MSTALEIGTEKLLGGTTKAITGGSSSALNQGIANGLSRIMNNKGVINLLSHSGAEATEEFIQEFADNALRNITLGENNDLLSPETIGNAIYSAAVGGVTGAFGSIGDNSLNINTRNDRNANQSNINNMLQSKGLNIPVTNNEGNLVNPNAYQYIKSDNAKIDNLRKSASKYFNNSQETQNFVNTIENIISDKDYNVTFDNTLKSKNGNSVNAQITTNKNGEVEIKINPNSNRAGEFLLVHEITHAIETDSMKKLVLDYASKNSEFNTALESLKQTYGTNDVNSEVLADISGQLFGNQEFINSLSIEQPNIFRRIYNKIVELANKITGNSHEALVVRDLRNKWENAYRNSQNTLNGESYSNSGLKGLNNLASSNFKNNGLSNYQQALEMQKQGIDNEIIRQQTKWLQDKNGDWKFEVDDSSLTINNNILQKNQTYKLGDIINHDILFKLYPELANYEVSFKSKKNNGSYNNKNQTFEISNAFLDSANYKNLKGTLIHEIQHAIQHIEGFEAGTTSKLSKKAYYESLGEIEADNQKNRYMKNYTKEDRMHIAPESSKENPVHSQYESYISNRNLIDKTKDAVYPFIKKGLSNDKINQEILGKAAKSNNTLVDGRRLLENRSSFSLQGSQTDTTYRGEHQPDRMGVGYDLTSEGIIDESIYTNPEWYAVMSEKSYQESYEVLNRVRNNPNANVTMFRILWHVL